MICQNTEALPNENDVVVTELGMAKAVTNFENTIRTYPNDALATRSNGRYSEANSL